MSELHDACETLAQRLDDFAHIVRALPLIAEAPGTEVERSMRLAAYMGDFKEIRDLIVPVIDSLSEQIAAEYRWMGGNDR